MKLPSLFRLPRHNKFDFEPRYYDPIKEEIDNKIENAKRELEDGISGNYQSKITGSFRRKKEQDKKSSVNVAILFTLMLGGFFGYLFYGETALFGLAGGMAVYVYLRIKKII